MLALCKYMCVSSSFCDQHLRLLFSLFAPPRSLEEGEKKGEITRRKQDAEDENKKERERGEEVIRANIAIALGDLTFRFPNLLEPWTKHIYRPLAVISPLSLSLSVCLSVCVCVYINTNFFPLLSFLQDSSTKVRRNTMMVLTHLILNDMVKVKAHISQLAICLFDTDPAIAHLTRLFFHELSQKGFIHAQSGTHTHTLYIYLYIHTYIYEIYAKYAKQQTGAAVYNIIPDVLSRLSASDKVSSDLFKKVMKHLLSLIEKVSPPLSHCLLSHTLAPSLLSFPFC